MAQRKVLLPKTVAGRWSLFHMLRMVTGLPFRLLGRHPSQFTRTREGNHWSPSQRSLGKQHLRKQLTPLPLHVRLRALAPEADRVCWMKGPKKEASLILIVCLTCWKWTFSQLILFEVFKAWEHNKCYPLSDFSSTFWPWHRGGIFWKDMAVLSDDFQNVNLLIKTF